MPAGRARGFCLSRHSPLKQKHRSAFQSLTRAKQFARLLDKFKNHPKGWFSNLPSTGIEPVTFPMSRERATAAPTGLKSTQIVFR